MSLQRSDIHPGAVFKFPNSALLDEFQNEVALAVKPELRLGIWAGIGKLSVAMRPPDFNGNIDSITATSLEDPYEKLLTSEERGIRYPGYSIRQRYRLDTPDLDYFKETTVGFRLEAEGRSSKGTLDSAVEVFFVHLPRQRKKQPQPKKPYVATDNTYGHFYDEARGETVWYERKSDFSVTLRRPVSLPIYNMDDLNKIRQTGVLYNPANGTHTRGANPSCRYND